MSVRIYRFCLPQCLFCACSSLFHGSDEEEFVGFSGDLDDLEMEGADDEYVLLLVISSRDVDISFHIF